MRENAGVFEKPKFNHTISTSYMLQDIRSKKLSGFPLHTYGNTPDLQNIHYMRTLISNFLTYVSADILHS